MPSLEALFDHKSLLSQWKLGGERLIEGCDGLARSHRERCLDRAQVQKSSRRAQMLYHLLSMYQPSVAG